MSNHFKPQSDSIDRKRVTIFLSDEGIRDLMERRAAEEGVELNVWIREVLKSATGKETQNTNDITRNSAVWQEVMTNVLTGSFDKMLFTDVLCKMLMVHCDPDLWSKCVSLSLKTMMTNKKEGDGCGKDS